MVEENNIPVSLVLNFDQTPLKYTPLANQTLAKHGSKHVGISEKNCPKSLTATFGITFTNHFSKHKTMQSIPKVKFPKLFSRSANEDISASQLNVSN